MPEYTREQAEEILRRALAREQSSGVSHEDLVAAASEVGIDAEELEKAAEEVVEEQQLAQRDAEVRRVLKQSFYRDLARVIGFNGVLLAIDLASGPDFWVHWVALFSVLHVGRIAVSAFAPSEDTLARTRKKLEKRARRAREQDEARERARTQAQRRKGTEKQFERVVEQGVEALLRKAGDRLEQYNREGPRVRVASADGGDGFEEDDDPYARGRASRRHRS